jgi:hypothetical protein
MNLKSAKEVVPKSEVLSQYLYRGTEENHKTPQSG